MRKLYYGHISTNDWQTSARQYEDPRQRGIAENDVFIDEGVSGYHVPPEAREKWQMVEHDLGHSGILVVR